MMEFNDLRIVLISSVTSLIFATTTFAGFVQPDAVTAFWPDWYVKAYPDIAASISSNPSPDKRGLALFHWQAYGIHEGRSPNPFFNPKYYAAHNPDVIAAFGEKDAAGKVVVKDYDKVVYHWYQQCMKEGRQGSPLFDPKFYLDKNPDIRANVGAGNWSGAYAHYINYGIKEKRAPASVIDFKTDDVECLKAGLRWGASLKFAAATSELPGVDVATAMVAVAETIEMAEKCPIFVVGPRSEKTRESIAIVHEDVNHEHISHTDDRADSGTEFIAEGGRVVEVIDHDSGEHVHFDK